MKAEDFLDNKSPGTVGGSVGIGAKAERGQPTAEEFLGDPTEQRTILSSDSLKLPGYLHPMHKALGLVTPEEAIGVLEQIGAGAYGIAAMATAGNIALGRASLAKLSGLPFGDTFNQEYQNAHEDLPEYVPITPAGAKITEVINGAIGAALQKVGDTAYERELSFKKPWLSKAEHEDQAAKAGAFAQAATMAATLFAGPGRGKGPKIVETVKDPITAFKEKYPATANAIDASQVGKIELKPIDPAKPVETATRRVDQAIDEALTRELNTPGVEPLSIQDKLKLVISKYAGADVPLADQTRLANGYLERFATLQQLQDSIIEGRPKLPAPGGTVNVVTPGGSVLRAADRTELAQQAETYKVFEQWQKEGQLPEMTQGKQIYRGPGGKFKQRGAFDIEGLDLNIPAIKQAVEEAVTKGSLVAYPLNNTERTYFKNLDQGQWEQFAGAVPSAVFEGDKVKFDPKQLDAVKAVMEQINLGELKPAQRGAFDIEGIEKNIPAAKKAAENASTKGWAVPNTQEAAKIADSALEANYKAVEDKKKMMSVSAIKQIRRAVVSHDYDLQADLSKAGPAGEQAMLRMNVEHNASMIAKSRYDNTAKGIFDDLNKGDLKNLEKIIRLRRIVQIDRENGIGAVKHEVDPKSGLNLNGPLAKAALDQMEHSIPNFSNLDAKATTVFAVEKANIQRLLDEGLIDAHVADRMSRLATTRQERLDIIDPETLITHSVNKTVPVRSSGIPLPSRSKTQAFNMDARTLLIEDIARVENRIAHNNTMLALQKLGEEVPDNGMVIALKRGPETPKAIPEGWTSFPLRKEGRTEHILVLDDYAKQLASRPDLGLNKVVFNIGSHDVTVASILRTLSASSVFKAAATKYNPAFAVLAGLPMDILHIWIANKGEYSPHLPMFGAQMAKDMAVTAKDAFYRTGRWEQAMMEGMGPSFMTHEARANTQGIRSTIEPRLQKTRTALSFFGDWFDTWTRLAHRERLISQGVNSADATAMAVERLNFYRGGVISKYLETIYPYTNVTVNATSKAIETFAKDPKKGWTKVAWALGTLSAWKLANMIASPETDKAIPVEDKARAAQFTFGDQFFIHDADGNKRYFYVNIRLDQTVTPLNAAVVAGLEKAEYGRVPDKLLTKTIGQVVPNSPFTGNFPPSLEAIAAYRDNYQSYRDHPVYTGPNVKPEDQLRTFGKSTPTSPWAVMAGKATGMSPMGLEAAAGQLVNSNNFWLQTAGLPYRLFFQGMNPRDQAQQAVWMLDTVPGLKTIIKLTTPGTQMMADMDKLDKEMNSKFKQQVDGLDEIMFQVLQNKKGMREVEQYIQNQTPETQKHLLAHAKYTYAVDKTLKEYKASEGIPPRNWWVTSARIGDQQRAQVFYNEWVSAGPNERQRMMQIAQGLHNNGAGYLSDPFKREFQKQIQLLGPDRR